MPKKYKTGKPHTHKVYYKNKEYEYTYPPARSKRVVNKVRKR